jgi:hypothetical protein
MARGTPPAALLYQGLSIGPGTQRTYEIQGGVPIDGSRAILRDANFGSPFTIRVIPPPLLVEALSGGEADKEKINIIGSALKINDTFAAFNEKLEAFRASTFVTKTQDELTRLETFVADNGVFFDAASGKSSLANVPAISDLKQAASVIAQLNRMMSTPPLTMLVNPQSLTLTRTKKQQYSERNRKGYVFQAWGEEQPRLNVLGKTGAFIAGTRFTDTDSPANFFGLGAESRGRVGRTSVASGVQYATKRDSAAWQNLMSLFTIYRNNGYIYDLISRTEAHQWIGMVAIDYDQQTYLGHFENFSWTESEDTMLGGVEFTFDFTVSFQFDSAQREFVVLPIKAPTPSPSDPQWTRVSRRQQRFGTSRGRGAFLPQGAGGGNRPLSSDALGVLRRGG